jgi:hypothetical protein
MAGLVPAIYVLKLRSGRKGVDGRVKPGHDDLIFARPPSDFAHVVNRLP